MKKCLLLVLISFASISCNEKRINDFENNCFLILDVNKDNVTAEIKEANYKSTFEVEFLKLELDKGLKEYYELKPEVKFNILVKYDKDINPLYFKMIKSICKGFYESNSNEDKISNELFNVSYKNTNALQREEIEKYFPGIIYSLREQE